MSPQLNGGSTGTQPTVYVSGQGSVYAYDLGASGDTAPVTASSGFFYQAGNAGSSIAGIATNTAGDLVVVQNFQSPQPGSASCQLVYIRARSGSSASNSTMSPCNSGNSSGTAGSAIGVTFTGPPSGASTDTNAFSDDVDVLMHYTSTSNTNIGGCYGGSTSQYEVDRYQATNGTITPKTCAVLDHGTSGVYNAIAGSTNGAFFVDYNQGSNGNVERFPSTGMTPTNTVSVPGTAGPLAVAANFSANIGYRIVAATTGGVTTIYSFTVGSGGSLTFTHTLGTFNNPVGAVAVDNNGNIYVGVTQPTGTKLKVYGPTKTEATAPDYILNNPVRRGNPAGAIVTGIAIAQPNAAPPAGNTVAYNSIPAGPVANAPSEAFQATQSSEFGDGVNLARTGTLKSVTYVLSSWGCQSRASATAPCVTSAGSTFPEDITLNVHAIDNSANHVGTLIGTQTSTFNVPYRPSASSQCPTDTTFGGLYVDPVDGQCKHGLANEITFTFPASGMGSVTLPSQATFSLAYSTSGYGPSPKGYSNACNSTFAGCGYDSLNVIANSAGVSTGSYYDTNALFESSATAGTYCDNGAGGVNVFRYDPGSVCAPYHPNFRVTLY